MSARKPQAIAGRVVPSPRLTLHGAIMIALYGGTPVLALGLLLDLLFSLLD